MIRIQAQKAVALYLTWLGALCGAVVVMLTEDFPFRLTFVRPGNFFVGFLECQLFFVVFVWPLFLPSLLRGGEPSGRSSRGALPGVLIQVGVLAALAFPLALIGANVSNAGFLTLLGHQVRVAAAAVLVGFVFVGGALRNVRVAPGYFLAAFALSAAPPFLHFLGRELGLGPGLTFLRWTSPFWSAVDLDGTAWAQAGAFAAAAAALALVPVRKRDPGSNLSNAGPGG